MSAGGVRLAWIRIGKRPCSTRVRLSRGMALGDADGMIAVEMAAVHRLMGRPGDAILRVVELLRANAYHFAALVVLGESLLDLKRTRDAARAFARLLMLTPGSAVARKSRQIARLERG